MRTGSIPSLARPLGLSLREAEIMTLIAEGHSNDPEIRREVIDTLNRPGISLLFIDADGEVDRDMDSYRSLMRPGCFVVFDDYHAQARTLPEHKDVRVRSVVDEEVRAGRLEPFGVFGWGTWFGRYRGEDKRT